LLVLAQLLSPGGLARGVRSLLRLFQPRAAVFHLPPSFPACPADEDASLATLPAGAPQLRLAILSTYVPTQCGLATFSFELRRGLLEGGGAAAVDVIAIHSGPPGSPVPDYPPEARRSRPLPRIAALWLRGAPARAQRARAGVRIGPTRN
jgi:hypothetical protein